MHGFVFGGGFCGLAFARRVVAGGGLAAATSRSPARRAALASAGVTPVDPNDTQMIAQLIGAAPAILVTAPPAAAGCPGLSALGPYLARRATDAPRGWLGYLSTTGVYGDRTGGWVDENSALNARSTESVRRVRAERDWLEWGAAHQFGVAVFRLPGLYGPQRSPLDRVRAGRATRIVKDGQVFSRLHVDDLVEALIASVARPRPGAVYNLCDDLPAPPGDVVAHACTLLGAAAPPVTPIAEATLSPTALRFWGESKRVSNALAKAELGWRPQYPNYQTGLAALLAAEAG